MKIINEPTLVDFSTLNPGDVFYLNEFGVYMKTETIGTSNAVSLSYGDFVECEDCCKVQKVNCELVIH